MLSIPFSKQGDQGAKISVFCFMYVEYFIFHTILMMIYFVFLIKFSVYSWYWWMNFSFYFYLVYLLRASFKNYQFIVYIFYDSYRFQNIRRSNTLAFDIHLINFPLSSFCGHIMLCSPLLMSCYSLCFVHTMYADVYAIIDLF